MNDSEARAHENEARVAEIAPADTLTPADRYEELFVAVQCTRVFADSKTFVDCAPLNSPEEILEAYRAQKSAPDFDLAAFVHERFKPEEAHESDYVSNPDLPLTAHIDGLWNVLTREPRTHPRRSSLLPLPHEYVVPGGRFAELYYWDSYFTMLGLDESGRPELLRAMADNFAYLIDTYGHIPNGNRTYYLSRSQPPVFALMTELFEEHGICRALDYLPQLRKEYGYWMHGADELRPGEVGRRCVRLEDGTLLNRYWDDRDTPRDESYLEDVTTAKRSSRPAHDVYRDLRAGAASGWDYSSRWLDDPERLASIRTTAIVPVDLNSLLYKLESQIASLGAKCGDEATATEFRDKARARQHAMDKRLWNQKAGAYFDFDWERDRPRDNLTVATATPLFVCAASPEQAQRVGETLRTELLDEGGIATTRLASGEQWDRPNGWAPLQWLAMRGLAQYDDMTLARELAKRWLETVASLYARESKLVEKYVLRRRPEGAVGGGGGEYPLQDGFGWTNGVTRKLLHDDPHHDANRCRAGERKAKGGAKGKG